MSKDSEFIQIVNDTRKCIDQIRTPCGISGAIRQGFDRLVSDNEFLESRIEEMNAVFAKIRMTIGGNVMGSDPIEEPDVDAPWLPVGLMLEIDGVMTKEVRG